VELVLGDMEDVPGFADTLAGSDVLFHTAAYFREYYAAGDHWPRLEAINVRATVALAEAAHARGVQRLVHTSSSATIGLRADRSAGDEDTPPAPIVNSNLYFKSKIIADERLREVCARRGLELVQVLPGWMFGPGDAAPTASGRLVLDFLAGSLPAVPPGGMNAVDARDVAAGMIRAARYGRAGHKYILGGPFTTLSDVVGTLARVTGLSGPRARIPYEVAWLYAKFAETWARITGGQSLITVAAVQAMHAQLRVSSNKALRELGWRYRPLSETLRDEVAWFRSQGMTGGVGRALAAA
jgi:dihydroflavonol-4-reductase